MSDIISKARAIDQKVFGKSATDAFYGPELPTAKRVMPSIEAKTQPAQAEKDAVMKELSKKRRATMTSELSQARIGRRQLGAGV